MVLSFADDLMVELHNPDGLFYLQLALTAVNLDIFGQGVGLWYYC
jgi:hypothetical protein